MTIELSPVGVTCNLSCPYCYEHPMRDAGNYAVEYDMEKMKAGLIKEGGSFSLFGGEALLMKFEDLEEILRWGYERYGRNGMQTNAALMTDAHIQLFKKYNCHVGISVDGPDELNDSRWAGTLEKTREMTQRSHEAIRKLCAAGWAPSLIVTMYRGNASYERRPRLKSWLKEMDSIGVKAARLHTLEIEYESIEKSMALTSDEYIEAFLDMANFELTLDNLRFDIFTDVIRELTGQDNNTTCTYNACDPLTTHAVRGVNGQGHQENCGRTNKDGIGWLKAKATGHERQVALYNTPQEYGGCKDCRFFMMCKGQCPGTSEGTDWRYRTSECAFWMAIFTHFEKQMRQFGLTPLSLSPDRKELEKIMVETWSKGEEAYISHAVQTLRVQKGRGGKLPTPIDYNKRNPTNEHGDSPHGDHTDDVNPAHGDDHGDHTDMSGGAVIDPALLLENEHGDIPHGDSQHGDHLDTAMPDRDHGDVPHGDDHADSSGAPGFTVEGIPIIKID